MRLRNSDSPLYELLSVAVGSHGIGCATGSDAINGGPDLRYSKRLTFLQDLEQTAPIDYRFSTVRLGKSTSKGGVLVLIAELGLVSSSPIRVFGANGSWSTYGDGRRKFLPPYSTFCCAYALDMGENTKLGCASQRTNHRLDRTIVSIYLS